MGYLSEIQEMMWFLSTDHRVLFVGQAVVYDGQAMHKTLVHVPMEKRIEMPVIEEFQAGFCTGLSLQGYIPVCIYPRFDFLICAANQIINHLDKIPLMTGFRPKVILRTCVGAISPLNPGLQHSQDHTQAFKSMLKSIKVVELNEHSNIKREYKNSLLDEHSYLFIEHASLYA